MAQLQTLSHVYPIGSRINERGHLEIGGCDVIELAERFGTPAYVVAEDDLRARARAFVEAFRAARPGGLRGGLRLEGVPGDGGDVAVRARGARLRRRVRRRAAPRAARRLRRRRSSCCTATRATTASWRAALAAGVGLIVIDNDGDIERLERLTARRRPPPAGADPRDPRRARRDAREDLDRPGRLEVRHRPATRPRRRSSACGRWPGVELRGLHLHIGSQLFSLEPFRAAIAAIAPLGDFPVYDLGGGLGVAYTDEQTPPAIEEYVGALVEAAREQLGPGKRLLIEPGRSLVANGGVTLYRVIGVKRNVSTWVSVDGGMSDNLRPMLYGARYRPRSPTASEARRASTSPASTASPATC